MRETIKTAQTKFKAAKFFVGDMIAHSPKSSPTVEYWDVMPEDEFEQLFDHLSNPDDDERRKIREILKGLHITSLLDAGAGPCAEYVGYSNDSALKSMEYVGLDYSQRMLVKAHQKFPQITLVRGHLTDLPFSENSFDCVLLKHVLEHQPDGYEDTLREALRVARKYVVIDFFHTPIPGGKDIGINHRDGYADNWYSKSKFEEFLLTLSTQKGLKSWHRVPSAGTAGQEVLIYTLCL